MGILDSVVGGVGNLTGIGNIVGGIGGGYNSSNSQLSTMTPEQQKYYTELLKNLSSFQPQMQYGDATNSTIMQMLSGKPAYEINPETTEKYYRESIYNPSVKQYENTTRPAWMEQTSNLHSSYKDRMEQEGYENLYSGLEQQHGQLQYADEMARRQALESAAQRQLSGIGAAQSQNQLSLQYQMTPYQMMLSALGLPTMENVVNKPGLIEGLFKGVGGVLGSK